MSSNQSTIQRDTVDANLPAAYRGAPNHSANSSWVQKCPPDWQKEPWNIGILYRSKPEDDARGQPVWEARLEITAKNVPRIMRDGLHWCEANVQHEDGYFLLSPAQIREDVTAKQNWDNARVYILRDLEDDRWVGRLVVFSNNLPFLSNFQLDGILTIDHTCKAMARNWDGKTVYHWDVTQPEQSFNAVYDHMPMLGWWPGPKEDRNVRRTMRDARRWLQQQD
ncbi:hypothetical protein PT974_03496 [Cladobotryum mycophilum]|uniref:Uncharacterized protein n=1 Tax=Cladobotryum mycophilum TaxID=491253 RepID=A0ABR0ST28_9HYPO